MSDPIANADIIPYSVIISPVNQNYLPAVYSERRNQALITKPEDYYCAITGMRIDTSSIPFYHFPNKINPGNPADPNYSDLIVTLIYCSAPGIFHQFQVHVSYFPEFNDTGPFLIENNSKNVYYDIYDPVNITLMVNRAIQSAFDQIVTLFPGLSPTVQAPYFYLDTATGKNTLNVQNVINPLVPGISVYETQYLNNLPLYGANQPVGTIQMFVNFDLFPILGRFRYFDANIPSKELLYLVDDLQPNLAPAWFQFTQVDNFYFSNSLVARFVILTSTIPILSTQVPVTTEFPTGSYGAYKFLYEYYNTTAAGCSLLNELNINQQGFLRLYELQGKQPLDLLDLTFAYIDHKQNIVTINVAKNNCCSISMIFIKKSLFNKK